MYQGAVRTRHRAASPVALPTVVALVIVVALLASACTVGPSRRPDLATSGTQARPGTAPASAEAPPTGPGGPGRTADPLHWFVCPPHAETDADTAPAASLACAQLSVPVSYTDPSQGTITLRVARALAEGTPSTAPPLVLVVGDPGENGAADVAAIAASLPAEITARFAVVTVDVRGTGASAGIDCVSRATQRDILSLAADPSTTVGAHQVESVARRLTFDCGDLVGPSLSEYNTTNAADDLDMLRSALGVDALTYLGRGFGATLGAVYANRYPGRVAAMVLDSPADPLASPEHRAAARGAAAQSLMTDFAAGCGRFPGGCPLGDDPAAAVADIVDSLGTDGQSAGSALVTGGSVLAALLEVLPDHDRWPQLAAAIAALRDDDAAPLAELLTSAVGGDDASERLTGRILYRCNDSAVRLTGDRLQRAVADAGADAPLFGTFAVSLPALCGAWPAPEESLGRVTAAGAPPILVAGSVNNPRHPYAGVQSVANQLSSAVLVSWQSSTDGTYPRSSCVSTAVDDYLLDGSVPQTGILCPP